MPPWKPGGGGGGMPAGSGPAGVTGELSRGSMELKIELSKRAAGNTLWSSA